MHGYLPLGPWASHGETTEPIQTPTHLNTKHHSIIEITKKALALKIQTRGKLRIPGACWNESPESLDFTDRLYLLKLANSGEEHSRKSWSPTVCLWTTHCSQGGSLSPPFPVTRSWWQTAQVGFWGQRLSGKRVFLPAPAAAQPLKLTKAAPGIHSGTPSRMNLPKQTQHSRKEMIISKISRVDIAMRQGG